jgi:hypothetical protein
MFKKRKLGPESTSLSTAVDAEIHDLTFSRRTRNRHGGNNTIRPIFLPLPAVQPSLAPASQAPHNPNSDGTMEAPDLSQVEEESEFCSEDTLDRTNPAYVLTTLMSIGMDAVV